jgi:hypothetical protein
MTCDQRDSPPLSTFEERNEFRRAVNHAVGSQAVNYEPRNGASRRNERQAHATIADGRWGGTRNRSKKKRQSHPLVAVIFILFSLFLAAALLHQTERFCRGEGRAPRELHVRAPPQRLLAPLVNCRRR